MMINTNADINTNVQQERLVAVVSVAFGSVAGVTTFGQGITAVAGTAPAPTANLAPSTIPNITGMAPNAATAPIAGTMPYAHGAATSSTASSAGLSSAQQASELLAAMNAAVAASAQDGTMLASVPTHRPSGVANSRSKLVHFFTFLLALQVATWTSVAVCIGVSYWVPIESPLVRYAQDYISAAFILDAIANCIISLAFIYHLRSLHPAPACLRSWTWYLNAWDWWSPSNRFDVTTKAQLRPHQRSDAPHVATDQEGGPVLYASMHQLLWRSQVLLLFECAFTMSAVIIEEVDWTIDPLWFLMSVAMAVRLRVFCSFYAHLTDMLKSRVRRGATARHAAPHDAHLRSPGSQTHLRHGDGNGVRETSMASLSTRTILVPGAMAANSRYTVAGRALPLPDTSASGTG
ncbi:hypothetical protein GGF31_000144 [Allomyces arbusculus]|nr:hypothetical protein GGF31_000144 [Allomyces arbusculus]